MPAHLFLRKTAQRRVTTSRSRQWQMVEKAAGKLAGSTRTCGTCRLAEVRVKKARPPVATKTCSTVWSKGGVGRVPVIFPVMIYEIELNAAAPNLAAIDPDRGLGKIGAERRDSRCRIARPRSPRPQCR
jgi:hypothetical protein